MSLDITITATVPSVVFDGNITHNLTKMAAEAGIYYHLWRPEEVDITTAKQLIAPLTVALGIMKSDPARFRSLNPENGWGDYEGLVAFIEEYLAACKQYPEGTIEVSR